MEGELFKVGHVSSSKVQDCMGDVHSKDSKNLKSSTREFFQGDKEPGSPNILEYSESYLERSPYILPTIGYPVNSASYSLVDIAVEALEDDDISKEIETISSAEDSRNLFPKGQNAYHLVSSDKTTYNIDSKQKESTESIQKALAIETESTKEIQKAFAVETESSKGIQASQSVRNESTEKIQHNSMEAKFIQENQLVSYVETALTKEIQLVLYVDTESTKTINPDTSVDTESTEEIQPSLLVEIEPTKEIQPALSVETESTEKFQPFLSIETKPTLEIQPAFPEETDIFVETASNEEIQQALPVETELAEAIQPALPLSTESAEANRPALPVLTESTEEIQPAQPASTESAEEIQPAQPASTESAEEILPALPVETEYAKILSSLPQEFKLSELNQHVLSEYIEAQETIPSDLIEETKSIEVFNSARSEEIGAKTEKIQTVSEDITSTVIFPPVSFKSTRSGQPAHSETKLFEIKQPAPLEEFHSNKMTDSLSMAESYKDNVTFSSICKESPILSSNRKSRLDPEDLLKLHSKSKPYFPHREEISNSSISSVLETKSFHSLLNKEGYKNESLFEYVNKKLASIDGVIITPTSETLKQNFPDLLSPLVGSSRMKMDKKLNRSSESIKPVSSKKTKLTKVIEPVLSEVIDLNEMIRLNSLEARSIEEAISSSQSKTPSPDLSDMDKQEISSKISSKTSSDLSDSEENSNSFLPMIDTESFYPFNTDEYKNASYSRIDWISQVNQTGGHAIRRAPYPNPKYPMFEIPPLSPTTESRLTEITNFNKISPSNKSNSETFKFQNSEEKFNSTVPSVLENEKFDPMFNVKESMNGKPSMILGKNGITVNTSMTCQSAFERLPSPAAKYLAEKSVGNLRLCKDAIVPMASPFNFELIPSPPARNRSKKLNRNSRPTKDAIVPTGISSQTFKPICSDLEVLPLLSPAKNSTKKSVGNFRTCQDAEVPTDMPSPTYEPSSFYFKTHPLLASAKNSTEKLVENSRPTQDSVVSTYIPRTTCQPIFPNSEVPSLSPAKNPTTMSVGNSRLTKEAIVLTDIAMKTCEPSSLLTEMLPSASEKNHPKKSDGTVRPSKGAIVPTNVSRTTSKTIFPNPEFPLSPAKKNIENPCPTKAGTVPYNRCMSSLLSKLADWIFKSMQKSSNSFEKPMDIDFGSKFKMELEKVVDILDEMARLMDALITAAEGLPDPNSLLPYELRSETFPIRDRLVSAGLIVLRELKKMKKDVILDGDSFFVLCSDEGQSISTELALKARDQIVKLYIKISEHFLKLSMEIEKFRDSNRDFCSKMDIFLKGYVLGQKS